MEEIYKGYKITIDQDEYADSPDIWENEDCFLVYDHRQFYVERKGFDPTEIFEQLGKRKTFEGYWIFPVFAYIHSGVSLSLGKNSYPFTCPWDTSFGGFALIKRQKGWSYKEDKAFAIAESLIEEWNQYLSGEVYYKKIEKLVDEEYKEIDSCYGYYDTPDNILNETKKEIDSYETCIH